MIMAKEEITFLHIAKKMESGQDLLQTFQGGLYPIGEDTADAEQKQAGGLYFWASKETASRHVDWLTGNLDGAREWELCDKLGRVEVDYPLKEITFPEFRMDVERNKIRACFLEAGLREYLDCLNSEKAKETVWRDITLDAGTKLTAIVMEDRPYVEHKANRQDDKGMCLCFQVVKDGREQIQRAGVADVEGIACWLATEKPEFKKSYSAFLQRVMTNERAIDELGLAFKYCGEKPLMPSRIMFIEKNENGELSEKKIFDQSAEAMGVAKIDVKGSFNNRQNNDVMKLAMVQKARNRHLH